MLHSVTGHHSKSIDMTQGVIWKQIVLFAVPLILGNVFQQLYNTVDSIVGAGSGGRDDGHLQHAGEFFQRDFRGSGRGDKLVFRLEGRPESA